uniref:Puromycin-sensitive aminopeptidase (Trinotate prediction) n=1 Tax=Henneguya salminicola TaxID=69463 RepID=A0A6G3MDL5_HENSL
MPCKSDTTCFRLPENVAPKHYDLEIKPDISNSSFCGSVKILINIKSETDKIYFHTSDLKIENAHIIKNSIKIAPLSVEFQPKQNSCCLLFESKLDAQTVQLNISFSGKLEENMKGFYLTKYYDDYKHLHNCLATHFEPNDACRAFPCFDEPSFKATFKLTVIFEANKTVLSNTPLQSIMPVGDGLTAYTFDVTPIMSTYLVAYVMGDFDCLTTYTKSGIKFGVYMPIHKVHTGIHALKIGQNFLEFYNNYFKIPYPLKKMDVIALPDISIGAMENWGLVTFREDLLLVDPEKSSKSTIKFVNLVMAHEFAHQWFGNLVTMKWWTDLWLNEGFANWIEYLSVDQCCPHLNIWKSFTSSNYCRALELDSLSHSHPIEVEIHDPSELDEIFDDITYCKGASIIHMMVNYIGQPDFLAGLQQYFHQHMYSNVTTGRIISYNIS